MIRLLFALGVGCGLMAIGLYLSWCLHGLADDLDRADLEAWRDEMDAEL